MVPRSRACSSPSTSRTTPACSLAAWHALRAAWSGVPSRRFNTINPHLIHLTTIMPDTNHSTQSHTLLPHRTDQQQLSAGAHGVFEIFMLFGYNFLATLATSLLYRLASVNFRAAILLYDTLQRCVLGRIFICPFFRLRIYPGYTHL